MQCEGETALRNVVHQVIHPLHFSIKGRRP